MNIVLTELYELNRAKPARARRGDSSTSHDAAKRAEADTATAWQRTSIKAAVSFLDGATAREIASFTRGWTARKGYAMTDEAVANAASETIWCSPHCIRPQAAQDDLFAEAA
jgi:hypothetical protein